MGKDININEVREIRSRTLVYFGVGAIAKIADICKDLKARGINKVLVMTGRGAYKKQVRGTTLQRLLKLRVCSMCITTR